MKLNEMVMVFQFPAASDISHPKFDEYCIPDANPNLDSIPDAREGDSYRIHPLMCPSSHNSM
jgi:hypothetical protein